MKRVSFVVAIGVALAIGIVATCFAQQKPQYGGVLRMIGSQPPQMMSYVPSDGPR